MQDKNHLVSSSPTMSLRRIVVDFIIMAIISFIPLMWIPRGQMLTGHDSGYPINVLEAYKNRFFTWNTQDSMGLDNATSISVIPVLSVQAAASSLGASVADSEKVTFICWFFMMQAAMYVFAYSLRDAFGYRWFPLMTAVGYVFNFYLLALWRYGAGTTFSAYTALPLALTFTINMLRGRLGAIRSALYLSLALFLFNGGGGLSIPLFGGLLVSLGWAVVYFMITAKSEKRQEVFRNIVVFLISTFTASFLLNAYWLLPFLYFVITNYYTELTAKGGKAVVLMWTHSVSIYTSIGNLFRLQGYPDWYNNPFHPYANFYLIKIPLIFVSMLFAPTAYFSLLLVKQTEQKKLILYFAVLSLMGIFFAAGTHPPTGWLYSLFILYVPGFVVFRSAQYKFIPALFVSFAILIAYTLNYLLYETPLLGYFGKRKNATAAVFAAGFICLITVYHYPFFQRGFFYYNRTLSTLLSIPEYVHSYDRWSKEHFDDEGRTLILPRFNSTWKAGLFDWNYFSLYSPFNLITPKPFVQYSYYLNESQFALFNRLAYELSRSTPLSDKLLSFFQVRHILLAKDISYTSEDIPSESWHRYEPALSKDSFPLVWHEGSWQVHEYPGYQKNKIYGVNTLTRFHGSGEDSIGAILAGSDDFILPQILGKTTQNPVITDLPVHDSLFGIKCSTCGIFRPANEIIPAYTNILPGSMFYGIKRRREAKPADVSAPLSQVITSRLGLTLKRVSEIASMAERGSDTASVRGLGKELHELWKQIAEVMPIGSTAAADAEILAVLNDYAMSENKAIVKLLGAHAQYAESLKPATALFEEIINRIYVYKQNYRYGPVFVLPVAVDNADFYLDEVSLATDQSGRFIYPVQIDVGGVSRKITPLASGGKVMLGNYSATEAASVQLIFPEQASLLGAPMAVVPTIDNIVQSCQAAPIAGYNPERSYEVSLTNAQKMAKTAQIYLRKKKNNVVSFSVSDQVFKPDYAFNFSREDEGEQRLYFAGTDGDVEAYIYLCVAKGDDQSDYATTLSVHEMVKPTLFVQVGNSTLANRQSIQYKRINQTKYVIDLSGATFPLTLVFNENYNTLWRLSEVDSTGNLLQILTSWHIPSYARKSHMQVNGFANAWYIDKKPSSNSLILEFYPQSLFYKGILITAAGLMSVIVILILKRKIL